MYKKEWGHTMLTRVILSEGFPQKSNFKRGFAPKTQKIELYL